MAYYRRIRDLREDHDLTQRQLASLLRMPQPQYNRYEQGLRDIPTPVLIKLADLYETSTDYLPHRQRRTAPNLLTFRSDITRRSMDVFRRVRSAPIDEASAARFCPFEPKNRTKQRHPVCTGRQNCRRAGKVPCILPGGMYTETVPGLYYKPGLHSCIASGAVPLYVLREERYSPWLNVFTVKKTTKSARL